MAEFSEDDAERFARDLREAALNNYPNPNRIDCPGTGALKKLADSTTRKLMVDPVWRGHILKCSPCYRELMEYRKQSRSQSE
jgi:hypothetical protein